MKKPLFLICICLISIASFAQKEVSASTVFEMIDKHKTIEYEGVTIMGDLDLTELSNMHLEKDSKWNRNYKSTVEVPITFKNCVFKGHMIAYKNVKNGKRRNIGNITINWSNDDSETYSTDFAENVVFENCKFEQDSEFKYSKFSKDVSYGGSFFTNQANFKYADFKREAIFTQCTFEGIINFKYTHFDRITEFKNAKFNAYADFKYTNFDESVSFQNSNFKAHADFKYADFHSGSSFEKADFNSSSDFKYSNGKKYVNN